MSEHLKSYLAGQLRSFRREAGLTQEQLGERIDRTGEAVSNIERGRSLPNIETLIALSETLERPLREFFPPGKVDDRASANRIRLEAEAATVLRRLSDKKLRVAIAQITALGEM
jgi:transcriptional regulator with XRE-family HTH domain